MVTAARSSSASVTGGSDLTVTLLLMSAQCFSYCKHGFSTTVVRSGKQLQGLRKPQAGSVRGQKGGSQLQWQVQGAVSAPSSTAGLGAVSGALLADRPC